MNGKSAEAFLWNYLKNKILEGGEFRKQFSNDHFILCFFCASVKIAIKLNGQSHCDMQGVLNDEKRDSKLTQPGITVLRFGNKATQCTGWLLK
ncbi:MAG: DUF559 domain-containing protein [Bacteroidetes bacterium]|nr:DUF559 domain-containing protein [Bacteroidota bacterium]